MFTLLLTRDYNNLIFYNYQKLSKYISDGSNLFLLEESTFPHLEEDLPYEMSNFRNDKPLDKFIASILNSN